MPRPYTSRFVAVVAARIRERRPLLSYCVRSFETESCLTSSPSVLFLLLPTHKHRATERTRERNRGSFSFCHVCTRKEKEDTHNRTNCFELLSHKEKKKLEEKGEENPRHIHILAYSLAWDWWYSYYHSQSQ